MPSAVLPGGLGWLPFVLGAASWLALLRSGRDRAGSVPAADFGGGGRANGHGPGRRIGGAALGVAVLVPALIHGRLDARLLSGGDRGSGAGNGSRSVTTYNPITRLRGQAQLPPDPVPVLTYITDGQARLPADDGGVITARDRLAAGRRVLHGNTRDSRVGGPGCPPVGGQRRPYPPGEASVTIDTLDARPGCRPRNSQDRRWRARVGPGQRSVFSTRSSYGFGRHLRARLAGAARTQRC
jgi:hypothetical protein